MDNKLGWQSFSPPQTTFPHGNYWWDNCPTPTVPHKPGFLTPKPSLSYWCSWNTFGPYINEQKVIQAAKHNRDVILIDDGWTTWGDWSTPNSNRFPRGIANVVADVHSTGKKVGIWVAPYLASPTSSVFRSHRDWFHASAPHIPSLTFRRHLLRYENQEVKKYIRTTIQKFVEEWKVDLIKLDFLFAPYFAPGLTNDSAPHEEVSNLLTFIHKKYPHIYTIACGVPLEAAIGRADYIRISRDSTIPVLRYIPGVNMLVHWHRHKLLEEKLRVASKYNWHGSRLDEDPL